jgi:hypothetical protein
MGLLGHVNGIHSAVAHVCQLVLSSELGIQRGELGQHFPPGFRCVFPIFSFIPHGRLVRPGATWPIFCHYLLSLHIKGNV